MKLTTLKDGTATVIINDYSIPLADLGFEGTLMELIQSANGQLDKIKKSSGKVQWQ